MVLPLLGAIVVAGVDFGRVFYHAQALTNAARAGAMYGAQSSAKSTDFSGMNAAATNSAQPDIGTITATSSRTCYCDGDGVTGPMADCPPVGTCSGVLRIRVNVTATKTFSMLTSYPGVPRTIAISRTAKMRAQ